MDNSNRRLKRRVRHSYIVSTVSMALVLFLMGSVGYLMTAALRASTVLREGITLSVELQNGTDSARLAAIERQLSAAQAVASVRFSPKEEKAADEEFRKMFPQEFEEILDENPLADSFEVQLSARTAESEVLDPFIRQVEAMRGVQRVSYPAQTAEQLHGTVTKVQLLLSLFALALAVISLILLSNTIRLAIYSKRYLINTFKLVGATKWYIMRPFLRSAVWQGVWAGAGAAVIFCLAVFGLNEAIPELSSLAEWKKVAVIVGVMVGGGILLSTAITARAVGRFVDMNTNKINLY